jgi:hypothetical protein
MLAYVFWHWPRSGVAAAEYEALQRSFHFALKAAPSAGFMGSRCVSIEGAAGPAAGGRTKTGTCWRGPPASTRLTRQR